jgi:hypothetical protein
MDLDDLSPESGVGIAVALAAGLLLSPRVRGLLRRGAVTVLAGALAAGDTVTAWARQLEGGGQPGEAGDTAFMRDLAQEARGELAARRQEAKQ